jgi:hypothetical protein
MKTYRRTLSSEDAATATILIQKRNWKDFPPPMREFSVRVGRTRYQTRVVAEDCSCVSPPHQHYHLEAGHIAKKLKFRRGDVIEIAQSDGCYVMRNG